MSDAAPVRNPIGKAGFIVVLAAIALPIVAFVIGMVAAAAESPGGNVLDTAILGGLVFWAVGGAIAGLVALVGVVLCIVALTRKGARKVLAIVGLVLGVPIVVIGLPALVVGLGWVL